jgi:hypothetical protein
VSETSIFVFVFSGGSLVISLIALYASLEAAIRVDRFIRRAAAIEKGRANETGKDISG